MIEYYRYLKSEFYKLRHSGFFLVHLLFTICGVALMMCYSQISGSDEVNKLMAFVQVFAIAYPFAISIVCQIVSDQEMHAGHFQNILTRPSRVKALFAKFTWLLISGLMSIIIGTILFGTFFSTVIGVKISLGFFVVIPITLWLSNIFLYGIHIFFAFRFGRNLGIGMGAVGSLLSALLQTGLGEGIWYVIPYGLGIRISEKIVSDFFKIPMLKLSEIQLGIFSSIVWTSVIIVVVFLWFKRYNGICTE